MAEDLAFAMDTVVVFLLFAVVSAGVGKSQGRVLRFFVLCAETQVNGHTIFCVAIVAIWACPTEESQQFLGDFLRLLFFFVAVLILLSSSGVSWGFLLFFLVFVSVVEFLNPSLYAAQVEGLVTLLAVP